MAIFRDLKPGRDIVDTIPHARGRNGHIGTFRTGPPPTWREGKRRHSKRVKPFVMSSFLDWRLHINRIAVVGFWGLATS